MLEIIIAIVVIGGGGYLLVWVFRLSAQQERERADKELVANRAFAGANGFRELPASEWPAIRAKIEPYAGLGKLDTTGGAKTAFSSSRAPDLIAVASRKIGDSTHYLIEQSGIKAQQSGDHLVWTALLVEFARPSSGELLLLPKTHAFSAHKPPQGDWREAAVDGLEDEFNCFTKNGYQVSDSMRAAFSGLSGIKPPPSIHLRESGLLVYYELRNDRPDNEAAYQQLAQITERLSQARA